MTVASAIIVQCRLRLGDTDGDYLTMDRGLTWLDEGHNQFVEILYPLRRTKSFTVAEGQESFTLPDDLLILEVVTVTQETRHQLQYKTPQEFERLKTTGRNASRPDYWTLKDGKLYVFPMFGTASKVVLINDTQSTSSTSFTLASTSNLRDYGRAIVGTQEEIEYTTRGSVSISGATRGVGGTVASSHASGISMTQTDLEIQYPRRASALASQSTPDIPSFLHQKLQNYVLYLAELSRGQVSKADYYYNLWLSDLEAARATVTRQQIQYPVRMLDVDRFNRFRREG